MDKYIINKKEEIVISTLSQQCIKCIDKNCSNEYNKISCYIDKQCARIGKKSGIHGKCYICDKSNIKTSNFKKAVNEWYESIPSLNKVRQETIDIVTKDSINKVSSFVHNLKNHTAQCEQLLYRLIPEDRKFATIRESLNAVSKYISYDPQKTALLLLRLNKNINSLRTDFNVYDRLKGTEFIPHLGHYKPYDVVKIVAHMFYGDFSEKDVYINIGNYYERATFDFEAVQSALYYVFDNALKYIKSSSYLTVNFSDDNDTCSISISMHSLWISDYDLKHIFEDGYSGESAKNANLNGIGLGMYMSKLLLNRSDGDISVIPGRIIEAEGQLMYAYNEFVIKLKK